MDLVEELYQTDCQSLWSQMKHQEKQIQLKRRWLLGLHLSHSDKKQFQRLHFAGHFLPESLLRKDDVFYETAKSCVQVASGACNVAGRNQVFQEDVLLLDRNSIFRALLSCLDDLTNKGLHLLATTLTGVSVMFENTRWKMKHIIKASLPKVFGSQDNNEDQLDIFKQLSQLLNDPLNFRNNLVTVLSSRSQSNCLAVRKVLDGLHDLPFETLLAMHRKLKGGKQFLPQLQPCKSGWNRESLISQLRKTCERMLSESGGGDELQVPLAKAMAVVGLSMKLKPGFYNSNVPEFHQVSPEIRILQDDIARAIWLVKTKAQEHRLSGSDRYLSDDSQNDVESTGESKPFNCNLQTATTTRSKEPETVFSNHGIFAHIHGIKRGFHGNSIESHEPECQTGIYPEDTLHVNPGSGSCKNLYLAIQEAADETSMMAHNLVGHMLKEFAWIEGLNLDWDDNLYLRGDCGTHEDSEEVEERQTLSPENNGGSVIISVVEDLIPTFPKSRMETLRKLVGDL